MRNNLLVFTVLVLGGTLLRLLTHGLNFAPVGAIALLAGLWLPFRMAVWAPVLVMGMSDLFIGFHSFVPWVYGSYALIVASMWGARRMGVRGGGMLFAPLVSAVVFYVVTNFGVWLTTDMYTKDLSGLLLCYERAVPFFRMTVASDYAYTGVLYAMGKMGLVVYKMVRARAGIGLHSSV